MGIKVVLNQTIKQIIDEITPCRLPNKNDDAWFNGYNACIALLEANFKTFCDSIVDNEN
jgi:hypothetical protein